MWQSAVMTDAKRWRAWRRLARQGRLRSTDVAVLALLCGTAAVSLWLSRSYNGVTATLVAILIGLPVLYLTWLAVRPKAELTLADVADQLAGAVSTDWEKRRAGCRGSAARPTAAPQQTAPAPSGRQAWHDRRSRGALPVEGDLVVKPSSTEAPRPPPATPLRPRVCTDDMKLYQGDAKLTLLMKIRRAVKRACVHLGGSCQA